MRKNKFDYLNSPKIGILGGGQLGKMIAESATKAGIKEVVFDRNGYLFHGRVKALADAARENGLKF